jgi:hypothetical protein
MTDSANCPASAFLNSLAFTTDFDVDDEKMEKRYEQEAAKCAEYTEFSIAINGVWSARTKSGGCVSSYERIGYHAYSADLLQAALDSDCAIYVYRNGDNGIVKHDLRAMQTKAWAGYVDIQDRHDALARQAAELKEQVDLLSFLQPPPAR